MLRIQQSLLCKNPRPRNNDIITPSKGTQDTPDKKPDDIRTGALRGLYILHLPFSLSPRKSSRNAAFSIGKQLVV